MHEKSIPQVRVVFDIGLGLASRRGRVAGSGSCVHLEIGCWLRQVVPRLGQEPQTWFTGCCAQLSVGPRF